MKLFFAVLLLLPALLHGQNEFYVSHVHGQVKIAGQKLPLKVGNVLHKGDSLIFKKNSDYITLISPAAGSKTARYNDGPVTAKRDGFWIALADAFVPSTKVASTATRAGVINSLFDMQHYLASYSDHDIPMLIIDSALLQLGTAFNENRESRFFYLQYIVGNDTIRRQLSFRSSKSNDALYLVFDKSVYTKNGKPVQEDAIESVQLIFYDERVPSATLAGTFRLVVKTSDELLNELCVVKRNATRFFSKEAQPAQHVQEELISHVLSNFGKPDNESLGRILKNAQRLCK